MTQEDLLDRAAQPLGLDPHPQWAAGGRIVFNSSTVNAAPAGGGVIEVLDPASGARQVIAQGREPSVSPDGTSVQFVGPDAQPWLGGVGGAAQAPRKIVPSASIQIGRAGLTYDSAWTHDSRRLAYTGIGVGPGGGTTAELHVVEVMTGVDTRVLVRPNAYASGVAWLPGTAEVAVHLLDAATGDSELVAVDPTTQASRLLVRNPGPYGLGLAVSPDGRTLAFQQQVDPGVFTPLFRHVTLFDLAKNRATGRLGDDRSLLTVPFGLTWTPDRSLLTTCKNGAFQRICLLRNSSSGRTKTLPTDPLREADAPALSPDGQQIVYVSSGPDGTVQLRVAPLDAASAEKTVLDFNPAVDELRTGRVEELRWNGPGGAEIAGLLVHPIGVKGRAPLIVDVHGGPQGGIGLYGSILSSGPLEWHLWANMGYAVLIPDYRASLVAGRLPYERARQRQTSLDENLADVERGVDAVIARGIADSRRLSIIGHSYGGYLAARVAASHSRYRSVIAFEGLADFRVLWQERATTELARRVLTYQMLGTPEQKPRNWARSSPVTFVRRHSTPTLVISGNPSVTQGAILHDALMAVGSPTRHDVYDDGHVFTRPDNQRQVLERTVAFVEENMQGTQEPAPPTDEPSESPSESPSQSPSGEPSESPSSSPESSESPAPADSPRARTVGDACPEGTVPRGSRDDIAGNTHERAIDCVVWWEIAQGTSSTKYSPVLDVTREQMASFIARLVEESGGQLPADPPDAFDDDNGCFHERSINQLAAAGIVEGRTGRSFDPRGTVLRGQMAKFLVNAYAYRSGSSLDGSTDAFPDDTGDIFEPFINASAAGGFTEGRDGRYELSAPVRRDAMASFLARALDLLVAEATTPAKT